MPRAAALSLVAVAGHVVLLALVYWLAVRTSVGREFGDAALRGALLTHEAVADTVDVVLDIVSVASLMGALAVVATIALVRLARLPGLAAICLMVGANATSWLLEEQLLARPDLGLDEYTPPTLNSMPSGHSTAVFSAVAAVLFVLPHRVRLPAATAGGAFTLLTAVATMSAGWHRAGDSVAAFLVVGAWTAAAAAGVVVVSEPAPEPAMERSSGARWLGAITVGALILGLGLVLALDAVPGFRDSAVGQTFSLLTSDFLVVGALAGVLLVTLRVLELMEAAVGTSPTPRVPRST